MASADLPPTCRSHPWSPPGIGDLFIQRHWDGTESGTGLTISHADPRILISIELLDELHAGGLTEGVELVCQTRIPLIHPVGDVVTIRARNRTVIYEIREICPTDRRCWVAQWPD